MAKLLVATVLLVALLAVAQVSCFRTIVTTTIEEENQRGQGESQRCRQQIQQRYGQLQSCRRYLEQSGSPFEMDMYMNQQQQQQEQLRRQCCEPLRQLGECSCEAIRQIVQEELQQFGGGQGQQGQEGQRGQGQQGQQGQQQQQVQQMLQKARNLPRECNIGRECQIQSPYYYY